MDPHFGNYPSVFSGDYLDTASYDPSPNPVKLTGRFEGVDERS